jgi:hypothetical protein
MTRSHTGTVRATARRDGPHVRNQRFQEVPASVRLTLGLILYETKDGAKMVLKFIFEAIENAEVMGLRPFTERQAGIPFG